MPLHEVPLHMQVLYTVHCCASMFIMNSKAPNSASRPAAEHGQLSALLVSVCNSKLVTARRYCDIVMSKQLAVSSEPNGELQARWTA